MNTFLTIHDAEMMEISDNKKLLTSDGNAFFTRSVLILGRDGKKIIELSLINDNKITTL